jgi:hypothetical protein
VTLINSERRDLGCGSRAHEIPRVPVERPREQDVEARDKGGDDEGDGCEDDEKQPPPETEAAHPIQ